MGQGMGGQTHEHGARSAGLRVCRYEELTERDLGGLTARASAFVGMVPGTGRGRLAPVDAERGGHNLAAGACRVGGSQAGLCVWPTQTRNGNRRTWDGHASLPRSARLRGAATEWIRQLWNNGWSTSAYPSGLLPHDVGFSLWDRGSFCAQAPHVSLRALQQVSHFVTALRNAAYI